MQKRKRKLSLLYIFLLTLPLVFPLLAYAETRVTVEEHFGNIVWNKEGSPYILENNMELMPGGKLTIGRGVVVMSASTTNIHVPKYFIWEYKSEGIDVLGTEEDPVRIIDIRGFAVGKNSRIEHASFERTPIQIGRNATTSIKSSTISGNDIGISTTASKVSITDSLISGNSTGIYSGLYIFLPKPGPGPVFKEEYVGGYINASSTDPSQNIIDIRNTVFEDNTKYAVNNINKNNIIATDNWWGSPEGPGSTVYGAMITSPWLEKDPRLEPKPVKCCSSILFLPGFQASRLYTGTNRLWEPNRNDDVRKLFLDSEGKSLDPAVYTAGVLEAAFGLKNIYKKFVAMMNGVVADKTINEWQPFAYDWRMGVSEIVSGDTQYATTTKNLISEVERLAQASKTGKVTIISHSNGGLAAKMLGYELEKQGKSDLIDRVIFLAVPHLGTPQSVLGMLHGSGQAILGGAVLSGDVARSFGVNMLGAYGLLPSEEYFRAIVDPILSFAGKAVGTYSDFIDFLIGKSDGRTDPKEKDLKVPALLSPNLLAKSEWMHRILDTWKFPSPIKVLSIAGWGVPTTRAVEYEGKSVRMKKNANGDGTVVSESALWYGGGYGGDEIYFNQAVYQRNTKKSLLHADILESDSILSFMGELLATSSLVFESKPLPAYLSYQKPNASDYPWMSWITVSVHSPVDIDLYDDQGGHIGVVPLPGDPESDIKWVENTIPGGQYENIGDEKYITIPNDNAYSVLLNGTDIGEFTLNIRKFSGEDMEEVASSTYPNLPVTPLTSASVTISPVIADPPLEITDEADASVITINPCQAI